MGYRKIRGSSGQVWASLVAQRLKWLPAMGEFDSWVGKIPWRRKWQPTPVSLPAESHGRRSLVGYSPQGRKETRLSDFTSTLGAGMLSPSVWMLWKSPTGHSYPAPLPSCESHPRHLLSLPSFDPWVSP